MCNNNLSDSFVVVIYYTVCLWHNTSNSYVSVPVSTRPKVQRVAYFKAHTHQVARRMASAAKLCITSTTLVLKLKYKHLVIKHFVVGIKALEVGIF